MEKRTILCISREYGSGGRVVGEALAEKMGVSCYDKKLLDQVAKESGLSGEYLAELDEKPANWLQMGFPMGMRSPYRADYDALYYVMNDKVFCLQTETIKNIASQGSCVIIGRVAEDVLKEDPDMVSVFIHADWETRVREIMAREGVGRAEAEKMVRRKDKNRANYHNYYSENKWGACSSYHFSVSTSKFGVAGAVSAIWELLLQR